MKLDLGKSWIALTHTWGFIHQHPWFLHPLSMVVASDQSEKHSDEMASVNTMI